MSKGTSGTGSVRAAEAVYRALRDQITTGERESGSWLREGDIATELGVSRTPVREALRRLSAEGLVRHEFNRGVQVESWPIDQLESIFTLRATLEPLACELAAKSGRADTVSLRRLATEMEVAANSPAPDFDVLTTLNNEFHRLIVDAAGNDRLASDVAALIEVPLVQGTFTRYSQRELHRSMGHHHELVDALEAGDPQWAWAVMCAHVRAAWSTIHASAARSPGPSQTHTTGGTDV